MKGKQKITLSSETVCEAIQEYLQKRMLETVLVSGVMPTGDRSSSFTGSAERTELAVTFTSEPLPAPAVREDAATPLVPQRETDL